MSFQAYFQGLNMRQAISYARYSTDEQEEGDSIRRQTTATDRFAKEHGLTIVERLLETKGRSALKKKHLAPDAKLGAFIADLRANRIAKGTVLIFEAFDRYSRFEPRQAFTLFGEIVDLGCSIGIVTDGKIYDAKSLEDPFTLMAIIMKLFQGNSESASKRRWLNEAWEAKRATASTKPMTAKAPFWLRLVDGKFQAIPEHVKTVKLIFQLTIDGHGLSGVIQELTKRGVVPPNGGTWARTSLSKILRYKSVIGEYQPKRAGKPVGDPIANYYPAIIDETTFYKCQSTRPKGFNKGRKSQHVNLFTGLLFDANDKSSYILLCTGGRRLLLSTAMHTGQAAYATLNYDAFEQAFLGAFNELKAEYLKPQAQEQNNIADIEAKLIKINMKIEALNQKLLEDDDFTLGLELLSKLSSDRKALQATLEHERAKQASTEAATVNECFEVLQLLQGEGSTTALRLKARAILQDMVTRVDLTPEAGAYKHKRGCTALITLSNKKVMRFYLGGDGKYQRQEMVGDVMHVNHRPHTNMRKLVYATVGNG